MKKYIVYDNHEGMYLQIVNGVIEYVSQTMWATEMTFEQTLKYCNCIRYERILIV